MRYKVITYKRGQEECRRKGSVWTNTTNINNAFSTLSIISKAAKNCGCVIKIQYGDK